jgi:hypothetical membrane protein
MFERVSDLVTDNRLLSGSLFFIGAAQFVLALIIAEALYPGYSIANNAISDLGAHCRNEAGAYVCHIYQPSATIFDLSVIVLGAALILAALTGRRLFGTVPTILIIISGCGAIGVGMFPETTDGLHFACADIAFIFAALSAIASYSFERKPLSYFSVVLGITTFSAIALLITNNFLGLGYGGMERLIVYPILIWALGLGGSLLCSPSS